MLFTQAALLHGVHVIQLGRTCMWLCGSRLMYELHCMHVPLFHPFLSCDTRLSWCVEWCTYFFGIRTQCADAPSSSPSVAISVTLSSISSANFCNVANSVRYHLRHFCVTLYTDIWTLSPASLYCHFCVPRQYSQPVRAQPWHSRMVLRRRTLLLQRCTPTSWWDLCRRRTRRTRSRGRPTCSWRKRRPDRCHPPPGARTAPMKWDLITLMGPCTI